MMRGKLWKKNCQPISSLELKMNEINTKFCEYMFNAINNMELNQKTKSFDISDDI